MMVVPDCVQRAAVSHPYPLLFATISGAHVYGFPSPDIPELIARKYSGAEKQTLTDGDFQIYGKEYERLCGVLEDAFRDSTLPDHPTARPALNDLLKRLRLRCK